MNEEAIDVKALKKVGLKYAIQGRIRPRMAVFGGPSDVGADTIR